MILLDTNVVSEPMRDSADPGVLRWLNLRFADCAISSVVIYEIAGGVARLPRGKRRQTLEQATERMIQRFGNRVYDFDEPAARAAASLLTAARSRGRTLQTADVQIAGIALANGLSLATRNTRDFAALGLDVIDPWKAK